ncbi:MAG: hypothetical protein SGBAC_005421 [Bacillariaceae sp.]
MTTSNGETRDDAVPVDPSQLKHDTTWTEAEIQDQVKKEQRVSFLTLGDGDFTYSLDLSRYLVSTKTDMKYMLTASGVDTRDELMSKYKDTPFVLKQLGNAASGSLSDSGSEMDNKLTVYIRHGINAIAMPKVLVDNEDDDEDPDNFTSKNPIAPKPSESQSPSCSNTLDALAVQPADHVMFHHPHLATEDAVLHQKFLYHLFHTVNHLWLTSSVRVSDSARDDGKEGEHENTGFFHLTLVKGQAERWKCLEAAQDQGFDLVWRGPFVPPPPPLSHNAESNGEGHLTAYQLRRHQTGKSFASRRPEWQSESLIFQRRGLKETNENAMSILPWDISKPSDDSNKAKADIHKGSLLPCPHCDKVFREERSRKAHLKAKHAALLPPEDNGDGKHKKKKQKCGLTSFHSLPTAPTDIEERLWFCPHRCYGIDGSGVRSFSSEEALHSHIVAKHSGIHKSISPDWKQPDEAQSEGSQTHLRDKKGANNLSCTNEPAPSTNVPKAIHGRCKICRWLFETKEQELKHIDDFTPPSTALSFPCRFCGKVFRDSRAQRQHENFCLHRNPK